jgi:cytochrome P450
MELDGFTIGKGEVVCLYFPGINMDPVHWRDPLALDFSRRFTGENNIIFGGSFYTCIGRRLTMAFLGNIVEGFTRHLPEGARVVEEELEVDGSWMAERIITRLPLELG